jgi:hypothetical protein
VGALSQDSIMIEVTKLKHLGGYRLHATFSDGTAGESPPFSLVASPCIGIASLAADQSRSSSACLLKDCLSAQHAFQSPLEYATVCCSLAGIGGWDAGVDI